MAAALPELARLRIAVFRSWPYIYDGSLEYEQRYLEKFAAAPRALIVAAYDGERVIGAATASPIDAGMTEFSEPLQRAGLPVDKIFYFGESVLLPEYRGHRLGHAFFDQREAHARSFPEYIFSAFCSVVRPDDHPLCDPNYRPLDSFWRKRGYAPLRHLTCNLAWKDLGQSTEDVKTMRYWIRALSGGARLRQRGRSVSRTTRLRLLMLQCKINVGRAVELR